MTDKRLHQESAHNTPRATATSGRDWKRVQEYEEELRKISPAFHKIETLRPPQPSAQEWRTFTQKLNAQLEATKIPMMRTLRDRITSTDSHVLRCVWIILAILALAILAGIITLSLHAPTPLAQQTISVQLLVTKPAIQAPMSTSRIG